MLTFSETLQQLWVAFQSNAKAAIHKFYDNIVKDAPCPDEEMRDILARQVGLHLGQLDQACRNQKVAMDQFQQDNHREFESIVKSQLKFEMEPENAEVYSLAGE